MDRKAINKACCQLVGWRDAIVDEDYILPASHHSVRRPLFTEDERMAGLMREEVSKRSHEIRFIKCLRDVLGYPAGQPTHEATFAMLQATPAQQVEAALRALHCWEEPEK